MFWLVMTTLAQVVHFNNKPFYGMTKNAYVGVYSTLKNNNDKKQLAANKKAKQIENMCSLAITDGIKALNGIVIDIKYPISQVLDTTHNVI